MEDHRLCVLNAGSSSLKFAVYLVSDGTLRRSQSGEVEQVGGQGRLLVTAADGKPLHDVMVTTADHAAALISSRPWPPIRSTSPLWLRCNSPLVTP